MSSVTREIVHDVETHPVHSTRTYWLIALVLTVLTIIEIAMYYLEVGGTVPPGVAATVILILSAVKFVLVVMFYMHLKYDSRIFSGVFLTGMTLGTLVISGLFLLYHVLVPLIR